MNEGILQSSSVQKMVVSAGNNWFTNNGSSSFLPVPQSNHITPPSTASLSCPTYQELSQYSRSQLLLGFSGEEDKSEISHKMQHKYLENWERQILNDSSNAAASYAYCNGNIEFTAAKSIKSCATSENIFMKWNSNNSDGGATKKLKANPITSSQTGTKVRKEKLGDRITALHQLVSPFGKTDTASVLLEAIGYIRFLHRQIEVISLPYLGSESGNTSQPQHDECDEEAKKDLRSRGLCLVPVSCTLDFGSEYNRADYWSSAAFAGNFK